MKLILKNSIITPGICYNEIFYSIQDWKTKINLVTSLSGRCYFKRLDLEEIIICIKIISKDDIDFIGYWDNQDRIGKLYSKSKYNPIKFFNPISTIKIIPDSNINNYNSLIFKNQKFDNYCKNIEEKSILILKELLSSEFYQGTSKEDLAEKSVMLAKEINKKVNESAKLLFFDGIKDRYE